MTDISLPPPTPAELDAARAARAPGARCETHYRRHPIDKSPEAGPGAPPAAEPTGRTHTPDRSARRGRHPQGPGGPHPA